MLRLFTRNLIAPFASLCLIYVFSCSSAFGQIPSKGEVKQAWKHIPANLEESLIQLDIIFNASASAKQQFAAKPELEAAGGSLGFAIGMRLHNKWKLWRGSQLSTYFNSQGVQDPGMMTYFILTAYHRRLNQKASDLGQEVEIIKRRIDWLLTHPPKKTDGFAVGDTAVGLRYKSKGFFDNFSKRPGYSIEVEGIAQEVDTIQQRMRVSVLSIISTERKTGISQLLQEYKFDKKLITPGAALWVNDPQWWWPPRKLRKLRKR